MTQAQEMRKIVDRLDDVEHQKNAALHMYLKKVADCMVQQITEAGGKLLAEYLIPAPADTLQEKAACDLIFRYFDAMHASPPYPEICSILGPAWPEVATSESNTAALVADGVGVN